MILRLFIIGEISLARIAGVVACGLAATLPVLATGDEDPVFRRYEKKVIPSELIRLDAEKKREALSAPATEDDVKTGKAIFTFDGLGETRVWKLPYCPLPATWTTLKQFPQASTDGIPAFANFGHVIQAEELQVHGKWKRYFGLVTAHGVAVAPAEEVDLWISPSLGDISWMSLSDGLDWGIKFRPSVMESDKLPVDDPFGASAKESGELTIGSPLPIEGYVMNCRGVARQVPTDFYHGPDQGGPALRKGVRLVLEWAPFDPRAADLNYPSDSDYKPMTSKSLWTFVPEDRVQMLETGERAKVFAGDLRDWFDIKEMGHYQFRFEFEGPKGTHGCSQTQFGFCFGTPPPALSVEQLNRELIPLGDKNAEERIRKLIKETWKPIATEAVEGRKIAWSEAVGGLQAAILDFTCGGYRGCEILVGLKNVSDKPLVVPVGHPENPPLAGIFDLQVRNDAGEWKSVEEFGEPKEGEERELRKGKKHRTKHPQSFKLSSGRMAVIYLNGDINPNIQTDSEVRIALHQAAARAVSGAWQGRVNTPTVATEWDEEALEKIKGRLEFPEFYPNFDTRRFMGNNMSGGETTVSLLWISNGALLGGLEFFSEDGLRKEFEHRFAAEDDMPMKLLYASVAAGKGSQPAALWLLETMKDTDHDTVRNLHSTLNQLLYQHHARVPAWLLAMVEAALSDERFVTGLEKSNWTPGTRLKISYLADEDGNLALALGQVKCPEAVPFLIDMVKKNKGRMPIMALGAAGDPRAVPILLEVLKTDGKAAESESESTRFPGIFSRAVEALACLRATETVPALLDYSQYPEVIDALDSIGDRRAVPVLREMVRNEGRVFRDGKELLPKQAPDRLIQSKIALATLEEGDVVPRLCALLDDKSFGEFDRRDVIWRLGDRPDPRAIPFLIKSIKNDPSGSVVNQTITVLSVFKYKAAVEGLIDCFDADFVGKSDWKRAYEPKMFQENIAESLCEITGRKTGPDKKKWLDWWQAEGKSDQTLK